MNLLEYVDIVVRPTVTQFLSARDDKRLAYLSCIATYHIPDYIAHTKGLKIEDVKQSFTAVCSDAFSVVGGLCNGTKHAKPRGLINPSTVRRAPAFAFDIPEAGLDEGAWDGPALYIEQNGNTLFVHHCVQAVILTAQSIYEDALGSVEFSEFEQFMKDWHRSAIFKIKSNDTT